MQITPRQVVLLVCCVSALGVGIFHVFGLVTPLAFACGIGGILTGQGRSSLRNTSVTITAMTGSAFGAAVVASTIVGVAISFAPKFFR